MTRRCSIRSAVRLVLLASLTLGGSSALEAQVEAEPVLRGLVQVGEEPLGEGRVVLHRIDQLEQGQLDSLPLGPEGTFSFPLPSVPDPGGDQIYFASVRHHGVLYFGTAVTRAAQLDSTYLIQTWDTLVVSDPAGLDLPVSIRNVFLEPEGEQWRATDLIQVVNTGERTLVNQEGTAVWSYPLPERATLPTMGGDAIPGSTEFVDGRLRAYAALPPGERVFVMRYLVPDPFVNLPLPGETQVLEVLVREPAPRIEAPGLEGGLPVELEEGSTYRRFSGSELSDTRIQLLEGEESRSLPLAWIVVGLALLLASVALWAVMDRPSRDPEPVAAAADEVGERKALLREIALLDREFEARGDPTPEERATYRNRRRVLLDRLSSAE